MDNLARLRDDRIDLRVHQAKLVEAEAAALTALEKVSDAVAASVSFVREMKLSITHPRVRQLLKGVRSTFGHAIDQTDELSRCHRIAQGIIDHNKSAEVVMSGGVPKGDHPNSGERQFG